MRYFPSNSQSCGINSFFVYQKQKTGKHFPFHDGNSKPFDSNQIQISTRLLDQHKTGTTKQVIKSAHNKPEGQNPLKPYHFGVIDLHKVVYLARKLNMTNQDDTNSIDKVRLATLTTDIEQLPHHLDDNYFHQSITISITKDNSGKRTRIIISLAV